jgi:serine/threonine protein phosphatase PrpC
MTSKTGAFSATGRRSSNEDTHYSFSSHGTVFQMINDGHGGPCVSEFATQEIMKRCHIVEGDLENLDIKKEWDEINKSIPKYMYGGSCSIAASITHRYDRFCIVVANLGDSQCYAGPIGSSIGKRFGRDHHPNAPDEMKRIIEAGGSVSGNRISGMLAVSRAFGDFGFSGVSCTPEIHTHSFSDSQPIILITACDGFFESGYSNWNPYQCFTGESIWMFIKNLITENPEKSLDWVAEQTTNMAFQMGSRDNLTICISVIRLV